MACTLTWLISLSITTRRVEERATAPSPSIKVPPGPTSMMVVEEQAGLLLKRQPADKIISSFGRGQPRVLERRHLLIMVEVAEGRPVGRGQRRQLRAWARRCPYSWWF